MLHRTKFSSWCDADAEARRVSNDFGYAWVWLGSDLLWRVSAGDSWEDAPWATLEAEAYVNGIYIYIGREPCVES